MKVGDRVEIHPGLDAWMQGDRYGVITKVTLRKGERHFHVNLDKSGRRLVLKEDLIANVID